MLRPLRLVAAGGRGELPRPPFMRAAVAVPTPLDALRPPADRPLAGVRRSAAAAAFAEGVRPASIEDKPASLS